MTDVVEEARDIIDCILAARNANNEEELSELQARAALVLLEVRRLNRAARTSAEEAKATTADSRSRLDAVNILLKNFEFQRHHLLQEIQRCRDFVSADSQIELVPLHDFLARAPSELRTEEIQASEHLLLQARLKFELQERERLRVVLDELEGEKTKLLEKNAMDSEAVDGLRTDIRSLLSAAKPIQSKIALSDSGQALSQAAQLGAGLTTPLYLIFTHLLAYKDVEGGQELSVVIVESPPMDFSLFESPAAPSSPNQQGDSGPFPAPDVVAAPGQDVDMVDAVPLSTGQQPHQSASSSSSSSSSSTTTTTTSTITSTTGSTASLTAAFYTRARYSLAVTLSSAGGHDFQAPLHLRFDHLSRLGLVTVTATSANYPIETLGNLLSGDDLGSVPPSLTALYSTPKGFVFDPVKGGRAFRWAQALGGLDVGTQDYVRPSVAIVLAAIRARLTASVSLSAQLKAISKKVGTVTSAGSRVSSLSPPKSGEGHEGAAHTNSLTPSTHAAFVEGRSEREDDDCDTASYYCALISCLSLRVSAIIRIPLSYPSPAPTFHLRLSDSASFRPQESFLRAVEDNVNNYGAQLSQVESTSSECLSHQYSRLSRCIEVLSVRGEDSEEAFSQALRAVA